MATSISQPDIHRICDNPQGWLLVRHRQHHDSLKGRMSLACGKFPETMNLLCGLKFGLNSPLDLGSLFTAFRGKIIWHFCSRDCLLTLIRRPIIPLSTFYSLCSSPYHCLKHRSTLRHSKLTRIQSTLDSNQSWPQKSQGL